MPRDSAPTRRVTDVLAAVMAAPREPHSLAALARQTGVSKATCLGIVNELARAGWLLRDEADKTYRPGPAMLAAGAAATDGFVAVELARGAMRDLAREVGAPCAASAVIDHQVTVLARADVAGSPFPPVRPGDRFPFAPPYGAMYVAWDSDDAVEAWLRRPGLSGFEVDADHLRAVVAASRERGYLVERFAGLDSGVYSLLVHLGGGRLGTELGSLLRHSGRPGGEQYLLDPIKARRSYDVSLVCAPVFDGNGHGEMTYLLAVLLMRSGMAGSALRRTVQALVRTTDGLSRALGQRTAGAEAQRRAAAM